MELLRYGVPSACRRRGPEKKDFVSVLVWLVRSSRAPPDAAAPDFFSPWLVSTPNSRWDPPAAARTAMLPSPRREPRTMLVVVRQPRGEQNHIKKSYTKRINKNRIPRFCDQYSVKMSYVLGISNISYYESKYRAPQWTKIRPIRLAGIGGTRPPPPSQRL